MKLLKSLKSGGDLKEWLPALVVMAIIFALSSVNGVAIKSAGLGQESYHISGHFLLYFVLVFAMYRGTKHILSAIVLTIVYGLTDEFHQTFILERSASLTDIVVDSASALAGGLIVWKYYPHLPKILKDWLKN